MLRLREVEKKLEEIERMKESEITTESYKWHLEHLKSLEVAYRKERIKALVNSVDDTKDYYSLYEDAMPKGMYK